MTDTVLIMSLEVEARVETPALRQAGWGRLHVQSPDSAQLGFDDPYGWGRKPISDPFHYRPLIIKILENYGIIPGTQCCAIKWLTAL